jgi:hypothetical protein
MARLGDVDHDGDTIMTDWAEDEGSVSSQKSPLLTLPGELRNKIYEYALTEDNKAEVRVNPGIFTIQVNGDLAALHTRPSLVKNGHKINQLKYICRQLH